MSFQGLDKILEIVTQQPEWEGYRQYCHLVECWKLVVSASLVHQTRPLYISRQVLWVATASAVLAQELSLQRYILLKKLNLLLPEPLEDLRFSSARWHLPTSPTADLTFEGEPLSTHPSYIEGLSKQTIEPELALGENTQESFRRWLEKMRHRARTLPLCPLCQCPTTAGELQRWDCCVFCLSQQQNFQA